MKSLYLYFKFGVFILSTIPNKIKVSKLKKKGRIEEADRIIQQVVIKWARFTVKNAGITLHVNGQDNIPKENCLFVSNHQGLLDIPVILCAVNKSIGFIAKKELEKYRLASDWMKEVHSVFIDRSNIRDSIKSINEGIENLKKGYNMAIFPEGTRSRGPKLGIFKKGSMKLALKSGVLVVPIAIDGTYKVLEANGGKVSPAKVTVTILKPLDPKNFDKEKDKDLSEIVRDEIERSLEDSRKD